MNTTRTPPMRPAVRIASRVTAVALTLLAVLACGAAAAGAHEGDGELTLQLTDPPAPAEPGPVHYQVLLTFLDDGHPAPHATVTVVAERSGAPPVGPLAMAAGAAEGTYEATVRFPSAGSWTVRVTAVAPAALLELTQDLPAAPTTSAAPATSPTTTSPTTTSPTTASASATTSATTASGGTDGGGSGAWLPVVLAVAVAAAVIAGAAVLVRRRRPRPPAPRGSA